MPYYEVVVTRTEESHARTIVEADTLEEAWVAADFIPEHNLRYDHAHKSDRQITAVRIVRHHPRLARLLSKFKL